MRTFKAASMVLGIIVAGMAVLAGCGAGGNSGNGGSGGGGASGGTTAAETSGGTSGGTSAGVSSGKPVQLKIWGGVPAESGPDQVMEAFNEAFADKGMTATYERFVNDESGNLKLDTALLSGNDVDIFVSYSVPKLKQRVEAGMAVDLTEFAGRDSFDFEQSFGPIVKDYYINGKPYTVPTYAYKYSFMINKDIFEENGIPIPTSWTLEQFRDIAKKLTTGSGTEKRYGAFLSLINQQLPAFIVGTKTGGDYYFKNGSDREADFDNPLYEYTLQTFSEMILQDQSVVSYTDMVTQKLSAINMFIGGQVAISDAYWTVRDVKDKEKYPHTFETAFVPMPTVEPMTPEETIVSGGYMDYFSINSKSEHQEAAWEFIKWYSTGGMEPMIPFGRIPAYVNFDKDIVASSFAAGVEDLFDMESFKTALLRPENRFQTQKITTKLPEISKIVNEEFEAAYIGTKDAQTALADAKRRSDEILKQQ